MAEIAINYDPQPKQAELHMCSANEVLYGGAAGPGKSHSLRMEGLIWALRIPGLQVYLFRRTFPELEKNHILPSRIFFPNELGTYKDQKRRWDFVNGSMIHFCHCQHESDVFQYQGAEIHLLLIDELTTFTEFQYDYLRGRTRCALEIPDKWRHKIPGITCATNPGGVGHQFAKERWVDFAKPMETKKAPNNEGGMTRCYIPGLLEDNPILMERDPEYIHRLDALPEPYRSAYKSGDWDIFMGQAFAFSKKKHVIDPIRLPFSPTLYMTFDWGFAKPYSVGYWWVDEDERIYRFSEIYGCLHGQKDTGLRQTDSEMAEKIVEHEKMLGIWKMPITRLCDPTCFNKKPDYKGGGQGASTADEFAQYGIFLSPGDPNRKLKIRQFQNRLRVYDDMPPMLQVYSTCKDFIRTIPLLQADEKNPEDIDTTQEDHIYDEACHIMMARPVMVDRETLFPTSEAAKIDDIVTGREKNINERNIYVEFDSVEFGGNNRRQHGNNTYI